MQGHSFHAVTRKRNRGGWRNPEQSVLTLLNTTRMASPIQLASGWRNSGSGRLRGAVGGRRGGENRGQEGGGVRGTHRSLLQTGGRKEPRFSSTHAFTFTGRSMVCREPHSCAESSALSKGRASARPPIGRLVNKHPEGQRAGQSPGLAAAPLGLWSGTPHAPPRARCRPAGPRATSRAPCPPA